MFSSCWIVARGWTRGRCAARRRCTSRRSAGTRPSCMTPLQCAAERARASVVEILTARPEYLHRAMAMRYDTRYGLMLKKPAEPIPAYDNWKESTTME
ncbi:Feminization 1-like protein, partial [Operophtera brumata]